MIPVISRWFKSYELGHIKSIIMTLFTASFATIIYRYYLMAAVVIATVLSGHIAFSLLALPIFLSAIMAPTFNLRAHRKRTSGSVGSFSQSLAHS